MKRTEHEEKMTSQKNKTYVTSFPFIFTNLRFFILSPQKLQNLKPIFLVRKFIIVFMLDCLKCSTAGFKRDLETAKLKI